MALDETVRERGYAFRQHLEKVGWTRRASTVVDLDDEQRAALEADGMEGLSRVLERQGKWTFPALDIEELLPVDVVIARDGRVCVAVVVSGTEPQLAATRSDTPKFAVGQSDSGRVIVTGPHGQGEGMEVVDRDLF